jgi:cytochrome c553
MGKRILLGVVAMSSIILSASLSIAASPLDTPGASKAMVCTACHGPDGNSPGNTMPNIAGMQPNYFKKAIKDYAEGKRPSPEMEPYSKYVMYAGVDEIAAYYAEQKRQPLRIKIDAKAAGRGQKPAGACIACHGPKGQGDANIGMPGIQGQPPGYLQAQMLLFKEDKRKLDDPAQEELKKKQLKAMSDQEIADVATYYASLK